MDWLYKLNIYPVLQVHFLNVPGSSQWPFRMV